MQNFPYALWALLMCVCSHYRVIWDDKKSDNIGAAKLAIITTNQALSRRKDVKVVTGKGDVMIIGFHQEKPDSPGAENSGTSMIPSRPPNSKARRDEKPPPVTL
jgi:hypothetical protein